MKKIFIFFSFLFFIIIFVSCKKENNDIDLPEIDKILTINIFNDGSVNSYIDKEDIKNIVSIILDSNKTSKDSVNEIPNTESYIVLEMVTSDKTYTIYLYNKNEEIYLEIPYQGIYEVNEKLYEFLEIS